MSISFTPSQLHIIALAEVFHETEVNQGGEYGCSARDELITRHRSAAPRFSIPCNEIGVPERMPTPAERAEYHHQVHLREEMIHGEILLVARAYARFRKEFEYYTERKGALAPVKQYHRLLIDTLAPFLSKK